MEAERDDFSTGHYLVLTSNIAYEQQRPGSICRQLPAVATGLGQRRLQTAGQDSILTTSWTVITDHPHMIRYAKCEYEYLYTLEHMHRRGTRPGANTCSSSGMDISQTHLGLGPTIQP